MIAGSFSAAIGPSNDIIVWGEGEFGVFDNPQKIFMDQVEFQDCFIGKFNQNASAFAISKEGKVYSWGQNSLG